MKITQKLIDEFSPLIKKEINKKEYESAIISNIQSKGKSIDKLAELEEMVVSKVFKSIHQREFDFRNKKDVVLYSTLLVIHDIIASEIISGIIVKLFIKTTKLSETVGKLALYILFKSYDLRFKTNLSSFFQINMSTDTIEDRVSDAIDVLYSQKSNELKGELIRILEIFSYPKYAGAISLTIGFTASLVEESSKAIANKHGILKTYQILSNTVEFTKNAITEIKNELKYGDYHEYINDLESILNYKKSVVKSVLKTRSAMVLFHIALGYLHKLNLGWLARALRVLYSAFGEFFIIGLISSAKKEDVQLYQEELRRRIANVN